MYRFISNGDTIENFLAKQDTFYLFHKYHLYSDISGTYLVCTLEKQDK